MPLDERRLIRDAMDRLLTGQPIRSNGALTVVALAEEAGVKRHLLTHRHPDLKNEFYAKVRSQGTIPQNEVDLRSKITDLESKIKNLRIERDALRAEASILRRMNNVFSVENAQHQTGSRRGIAQLETVRYAGDQADPGRRS